MDLYRLRPKIHSLLRGEIELFWDSNVLGCDAGHAMVSLGLQDGCVEGLCLALDRDAPCQQQHGKKLKP